MKITCIQLNSELGNPDANFTNAAEQVEAAAQSGADVIVLPELWNVGFFPEKGLSDMALGAVDRVMSELAPIAKRYRCNLIAGSVADNRDGKVYNTGLVIDRSGECIAKYDKTHLFTPMGEHEHFSSGSSVCRFELDGVPCALIICYELRFPELIRDHALSGAQILFMVSQWPQTRLLHLQTLTAARAIENQLFFAMCNGCGVAGQTKFAGNSMIVNPLGAVLAQACDRQTVITAQCDLSIMHDIRQSINVFNDRRAELYGQ